MANMKGVNSSSPAGPGRSFRGVRAEHHWLAGLVAMLVSFSIHAALIWLASWVDFAYLSRPSEAPPVRRFETVQVDHVALPDDTRKVLEALRSLETVSDARRAGMDAALETLQQQPDAAAIEPPAVRSPEALPDLGGLSGAEPPPLEVAWQPRQEILAIESRTVTGPELPLPRREIPAIDRIMDVPDVVLPVQAPAPMRIPETIRQATLPTVTGIEGFGWESLGPSEVATGTPVQRVLHATGGRELFEEAPELVTTALPIENTLRAQVETFARPGESYGYFRLTIARAGAEVLPVIPKDVLFLQDTSATIAERRLHFSREGLRRSMGHVFAQDRFNIATFVERTAYAFPDWVYRSPENDAQARGFLDAMQAEGNTDFLKSMQDILGHVSDPARPVIVIVVTDGLMHSGVTDSTEIIARFTQENAGRVSVFAVGVANHANTYLLDMLSRSNMGEGRYVPAGRWDIPDVIQSLMASVSRPVLSGLRVRFGSGQEIDGFPLQPGNLYLDRPLVVHGRYALSQDRLVFHAAGQAVARRSDMVFDLTLPSPQLDRGDATIRDGWSQQKMYSLIGLYTQTRDRRYIREMNAIARQYGQPVPFRTFFGR